MTTHIKTLDKELQRVYNKYHPTLMPLPSIRVVSHLKESGGMAFGWGRITIANWMLADKEEVLNTVRHEYAHNIVAWLAKKEQIMSPKISHGKEFHETLKKIAPRTWKSDLHWHYTTAITVSREKHGLNKKEYQKYWHVYTCTEHCGYKFYLRRVPSYIKKGLTHCPKCKANGLFYAGKFRFFDEFKDLK